MCRLRALFPSFLVVIFSCSAHVFVFHRQRHPDPKIHCTTSSKGSPIRKFLFFSPKRSGRKGDTEDEHESLASTSLTTRAFSLLVLVADSLQERTHILESIGASILLTLQRRRHRGKAAGIVPYTCAAAFKACGAPWKKEKKKRNPRKPQFVEHYKQRRENLSLFSRSGDLGEKKRGVAASTL